MSARDPANVFANVRDPANVFANVRDPANVRMSEGLQMSANVAEGAPLQMWLQMFARARVIASRA